MSRLAAAAVWLALLLLPGPVYGQEPSAPAADPESIHRLSLRIKPLPPGVRHVTLESDDAGGRVFVVERTDQGPQRLSPEEFAALFEPPSGGRRLLFGLLNITSVAGILWVALGLFGQVLFSGRMLLQWIASERKKRSVVPVSFWWMSLVGASMLLLYFIWRRDIVGVLGQSTGWLIYARNLWLIFREQSRQNEDESPAAEPAN